MAVKIGGTTGSEVWFLSRRYLGEQFLQNGQIVAAINVFQDIQARLGEVPSYNRCLTLSGLSGCYKMQGQLAAAEQLCQQELADLSQLEQSNLVRRQTGMAQFNLADVLYRQYRYDEAKEIYQAALKIANEQGDQRQIGAIHGQLGMFAYMRDELAEAEKRYQEALYLFQSLNEPVSESIAWHNLGLIYQQAKHWEAAEQAYRQAARLKEEQGLLAGSNGAGESWDQLAQVCYYTGRPAEAEQWYHKALAVFQGAADQPHTAVILNNLADLLANDLARLNEAHRYAEESLAIKETLDPVAAEIWKTYNILADIASQQGESSQAAAYRAKGRQAYFAFPV